MIKLLTVEIPSATRRRLEMMGFPHDISGRDVASFLIEQGLSVLEKHRAPPQVAEPLPSRKVGLLK